jgi:hypothetical protein
VLSGLSNLRVLLLMALLAITGAINYYLKKSVEGERRSIYKTPQENHISLLFYFTYDFQS